MNIDHIDSRLDGKVCEVYFFESWTTYAHPVTPVKPLYLEQALLLPGYYRAWMCSEGGKRQFMLFEKISQEREPIDANLPSASAVSVYLRRPDSKPPVIERSLALADILDLKEYIVTTEADKGRAFLMRQVVRYSYRYRYQPDGSLSTATITNQHGKVKVLKD